MSTDNTTGEYLAIFRCAGWEKGRSKEELQTILDKFSSWYDWMQSRPEIKDGMPLYQEGRYISGKNGVTVADGPFAESKEAIGGFIVIHAKNIDEAVELAREWPLVDYGYTIEVRPVAAQCSTQHRLNEQLAHASA